MPSTERDPKPSARVWFIAVASLLLPFVGVAMALYGGWKGFSGSPAGWVWLGAGVLLLVADLVIDHSWSRGEASSEPDLNRRGAQLIGQVVTVAEAIPPGGRGVVRAADTVWPAEGAAAEAGAKVRVAGCKGTVLIVEPA